MNRRDFLSFSLLASVAGVMAARDASHEIFIGEYVGETTQQLLDRAHKTFRDWEQFGVDDTTRTGTVALVTGTTDEPGVAI